MSTLALLSRARETDLLKIGADTALCHCVTGVRGDAGETDLLEIGTYAALPHCVNAFREDGAAGKIAVDGK